jgi:monothiol glutaredoxin
VNDISESIRDRIQSLVASSHVVLFMKGTRRAPQCGFSASVVDLLDGWVDDYATVDVLADAELREGIKAFSDWPTIPQLYVGGEFIGGADILRELEDSGELGTTLGAGAAGAPSLTITPDAAAQFRAAFESPDIDPSDVLRLAIDNRYHNDLSIGTRRPGDLEVESNGVHLVMDRRSARRARGLTIGFVDGPDGAGFKIDGAVLLDASSAAAIEKLPRETPLYFHCHHGGRSLAAGQHFIEQGFVEVYNITGGIDAWSQVVDPTVKRY